MSDQTLGTFFSNVLTSAEQATSGKGQRLGTMAVDRNGHEWIYVQASAAISQYNVLTIYGSATAQPFSSAGIAGGVAGVRALAIMASASVSAGCYGWGMLSGKAAVKVTTSSTGTLSGQLYAATSAEGAGLVTTTVSGHTKINTLFAAATATTSTTASTLPVVFGRMWT